VAGAFSRVAAVLLAVVLTWALAGAGAARPVDPPARPGHREVGSIGVPADGAAQAATAAPSPAGLSPAHDTAPPRRLRPDAVVPAALALAVALGALGLAFVRGKPRGAA
jgi:hypothetical protein